MKLFGKKRQLRYETLLANTSQYWGKTSPVGLDVTGTEVLMIVGKFRTPGYTSHGSIYNCLFSRGDAPTVAGGYGLYYTNTNLLSLIVRGSAAIASTFNISTNQAFLIVATIIPGGTGTIYVNGTSVGSGAIAAGDLTSAQALGIGVDVANPTRSMIGRVGEFQIVKFPTTPANLVSIATSIQLSKPLPRGYPNASIKAFYNWKSGGVDQSEYANHLTPIGTPLPGIIKI